MHCTDEELVAHLDGELPLRRSLRIGYHLSSCWRCRTRRAAYETEIQQLTVASDEWPFPDSGWQAERRRILGRGIEHVEADFSAERSRAPVLWPVAIWSLTGGVAILVCVGLWLGTTRKGLVGLRAADVITRTARAENALYTQAVHQTFSVEIEEIGASRRRVTDELQVWSDWRTGRFATRLTGAGKVVKLALWRPAPGKEYMYRPALRAGVQETAPHRPRTAPLESLADYGLEPAQLEAAFLGWIETRAWNPISFASDISTWSSQDGALLRAETIGNQEGSALIRLTAQRTSRRVTAILSVDVESESFLPRLQTLRFETPGRAIEFRLRATNIRTLHTAEVLDAVFRPDVPIRVPVRAPNLPRPYVDQATPPAITPESMAESESNARALEARYVLHEAGACLGEPVRISEEPGGVRIVRMSGSPGTWPETFVPAGDLGRILAALADLRRASPPEQRLRDVPRATALQPALRQAWALKRLAEDFPAARTSTLPNPSWALLETMVRAHSTGLNRDLEALNIRSASIPEVGTSRPWRELALDIFQHLLQLRELTGDKAESESARLKKEIAAEISGTAAAFSRESSKAVQVADHELPPAPPVQR